MAAQPQTTGSRADHPGPRRRPQPQVHQACVEIDDRCITIRGLEISGQAFDAARACVARRDELEVVVREMLNLGGQMLLHGASQATVDSVSAEVDRLIAAVAMAAAEELPRSLEAPLQHVDAILGGQARVRETSGRGRVGS